MSDLQKDIGALSKTILKKSPTCDRCGATCGNYQYAPGKWRCPSCIWWDQEQLIGVLCIARSIRHMNFSTDKQSRGTAKHCREWNNWYDVQCEELVERHCDSQERTN